MPKNDKNNNTPAPEVQEEPKAPEVQEEPKAPEVQEEPKAPEVQETVNDGYEEIYIPKGYANDDPNLFVGFNGVNYILPKGKTSKVPAAVAAEIRRSHKAQERQDSNIDALKTKASK